MLSGLPLLALSVLSSQVLLVTAAYEETPTCIPGECPSNLFDNDEEETCTLYLAESSIEGAGLGIYTTKDIPYGSKVGEEDMFIPILDRFKTLPYRGQQHFLSWLGYVWPDKIDAFYHTYHDGSFPTVPNSMYKVDEGLNSAEGTYFYDADGFRVSAFAPGVASLANSDPEYVNLEQDADTDGKYSFRAMDNIPAGTELFLDYGSEWHARFEAKEDSPDHYETLEEHMRVIKNLDLPNEERKRNSRDMRRNTEEILEKLEKIEPLAKKEHAQEDKRANIPHRCRETDFQNEAGKWTDRPKRSDRNSSSRH
jgi:hypothetical protein